MEGTIELQAVEGQKEALFRRLAKSFGPMLLAPIELENSLAPPDASVAAGAASAFQLTRESNCEAEWQSLAGIEGSQVAWDRVGRS